MVASNSSSPEGAPEAEHHGGIRADLHPQGRARVLERIGDRFAHELGSGPTVGADQRGHRGVPLPVELPYISGPSWSSSCFIPGAM